MSGQSRKHSVFESIANVVLGTVLALLTQLVVFPLVGVEVNAKQNLAIVAIFTAVSLTRSYCLRRFFNWWHFIGELTPNTAGGAQIDEWMKSTTIESPECDHEFLLIYKSKDLVAGIPRAECRKCGYYP